MSQAVTRELTLLRGLEPDVVQQALNAPWCQCAEAWGIDLPADAVLVASAVGPDSSHLATATWQALPTAPTGLAAWSHVPVDWRTKLGSELIGRSMKDPLPDDDFSLDAAERALTDLLQRWRKVLKMSSTSLQNPAGHYQTPEQSWLPYSGALLITEPRSGVMCLLGREAYRALLPQVSASPPSTTTVPSGLLGTLAQHLLPVTLGLGEVEIPISDLLGLQIGDVIKFPIRLSDELPLTLAAAAAPAPALNCQLGQLNGRLAIKVVAKAKTKDA